MSAGRPPKPTELKQLEGTLRPDRVLPDAIEPEKPSSIPMPPAELPQQAHESWYRVASELHKLGVLSVLDLDMLKAYCVQLYVMERALKQIKEPDGLVDTITNKGGHSYDTVSAYVRIYNDALTQANRLATQFGLTPSSRTKIASPKKKDNAVDPWDDL